MSNSAISVISCLLLSSAVSFGSSFTTTSCTLDLSGVPPSTTVTGTTSCSVPGAYYAGSTSAAANVSASGGVLGVVTAGAGTVFFDVLSLDGRDVYVTIPTTANLNAAAEIEAEFTSSGPVRLGSITIFDASATYAYAADNSVSPGEFSTDNAGVTIKQGGISYTVNAGSQVTLPLYLGSPFSIQESVAAGFLYGGGSGDDLSFESGSYTNAVFTLNDVDGTVANATLIPEPGTLFTMGSCLGILAIGLSRRNDRRSNRKHRLR